VLPFLTRSDLVLLVVVAAAAAALTPALWQHSYFMRQITRRTVLYTEMVSTGAILSAVQAERDLQRGIKKPSTPSSSSSAPSGCHEPSLLPTEVLRTGLVAVPAQLSSPFCSARSILSHSCWSSAPRFEPSTYMHMRHTVWRKCWATRRMSTLWLCSWVAAIRSS